MLDSGQARGWADAICINQEDDAEKGEQILLMEHIYSRAGTVYVDLGDLEGVTMVIGGVAAQWSGMGGMGTPDVLTQSCHPGHPFISGQLSAP